MGWYSEVSRNISKIPDAIRFFEEELVAAREEVKFTGNIERASASMPGTVEHRFNQLHKKQVARCVEGSGPKAVADY